MCVISRLLLPVLLLPPGSLLAQDAGTLDPIVVTATRTPTRASDTLSGVEVIDEKQLRASGASDLSQVLSGRAGLTVVNQGGAGKLTTVLIRGAESDHTLILVDGMRVGAGTSGLAAIADLPVEQIERIEIVRGPRSTLYGGSALGGVIHVMTKRGRQQGTRLSAMAGAGSDGERKAGGGVTWRGELGGVGVDLSSRTIDGHDSCLGHYDPLTWTGSGCFIVPGTHSDRDGYENNSVRINGDLSFGAWRVDVFGLQSKVRTEYDGDYQDLSKGAQQLIGGKVRWQASETLEVVGRVGRNKDDTDNYLGTDWVNRYANIRDDAGVQATWLVRDTNTLTVGLDWLRDRADVEDVISPFEAGRTTRGAFGQWQQTLGRHGLLLGVRRDDDSQFGGNTSWEAGWGVDLGTHWHLEVQHATAFKVPSFNELYFPGYGNATLEPERGRSTEVAIARTGAHGRWETRAYTSRISDLIAHDASLMAPNNVGRASIEGLETSGQFQANSWTLAGNVGWTRARQANTQFDLPRRPQWSGRLDVDKRLNEQWSGGGTLRGASSAWDDLTNTEAIGGYGVVDLRAAWAPNDAWKVELSVDNLLDKRYATAAWFPQAGRQVGIVIRWKN